MLITPQVAGSLIDRLSRENAGHWLDPGTEHPHRIALSIRADLVPLAVEQLKIGFLECGLEVAFQ